MPEISRTESGLYIASYPKPPDPEKEQADLQAEWDRYYTMHHRCPECGSTKFERTCMGRIYMPGTKVEEMEDTNWCGPCECGWRGTVHELVP